MSSLYARANARQAHVLRIVEGAFRDASNKHPEHSICLLQGDPGGFNFGRRVA